MKEYLKIKSKEHGTNPEDYSAGLSHGFELSIQFATWLDSDPFKNDEVFKTCKLSEFSKEFLFMKFLNNKF